MSEYQNVLPDPQDVPMQPRFINGFIFAPPKPEKPKVVVAQQVPDQNGKPQPNLMIFHCRSMLTDNQNETMWKNQNTDSESSEVFAPISRKVLEFDGVCEVHTEPYHMVVRKALLFKWDELAPKIMEALVIWHWTSVALKHGRTISPGEPVELASGVVALPPGTTMTDLGLGGTQQ